MALYERNIRHRGSGDFLKGRAGQALARAKLVYKHQNGAWYLADADATATTPVIGITLDTALAGQVVRILTEGYIGSTAWAWTVGGDIYASQTPGELTQVAPPAIVQWVAIATSPTMIYFNAVPASTGLGGGGGRGDYTYLVYRYNGNYVVYDDRGFLVHGPGADADTEINWALTTGGAGCVVYLEEDTTFAINDPITFTANTQVIRGGGRSSFIDGDALATGEHAIVLSGFDDCVIQELSVQTQDGGTKTCHCIFIEDGADRWRIEDVWIVDSDSDGIHIEGTSISDGWIINCSILDVDDNGIFSDMDDQNFLSYLQVKNNIFIRVGVDGIHLVDSSYAELIGNIIRDSVSDGISLSASNDTLIDDNEIIGTTGYDINIVDAGCFYTRIKRNRLTGAGLGCLSDGGTDTITPFIYCRVADPNNHIGTHPAVLLEDDTDTEIYDQIYFPLEFQELVTAEVVVVQDTVVTWAQDMVWVVDTEWGKICFAEDYDTHADSAGDTTTLDIYKLECVDISAAFTEIAAGDLVGVLFVRDGDNMADTVAGPVYYLGIRVRYV